MDQHAASDAFEGNWRDQRKARQRSVFEEAHGLPARHQRLRGDTAQPAAFRKKSR
jgi:hypothetical protein